MKALPFALGCLLVAAKATIACGVVHMVQAISSGEAPGFVRARLQICKQPVKFVKARFQMFKQPLKIVIPSEAEGPAFTV
jgi:hypothetical protein